MANHPHDDVRMRGFSRRTPVAEVLDWIDHQTAPLAPERVPLLEASGRVLAEEVTSPIDVPSFDRAMMDGYAVRAEDSAGASPYNRLPLRVIGQSMPGRPFSGSIAAGEAVAIMTGAPIPAGADAVLPAERVETPSDTDHAETPQRIYALGEVSPRKHIGRRGEDITAGQTVLGSLRRLRPQDLGVLSSIGCKTVPVVRSPRVAIVLTGSELLPAGTAVPSGAAKIADANGPMLVALVHRDGGQAEYPGILPDEPEAILQAMRQPVEVVLVSGGSSVGAEDHAPNLLKQHGELVFHGMAMRPSSPTGLGRLGDRLVALLPGNPVSCLCAYDFFAGRLIRRLAGRPAAWPYRRLRLPLVRKAVSAVGRTDYLRVKVTPEGVEPLAVAGASILSSTTRADGFVVIPPDSEGYPPGRDVDVFLYDE